MCNFLRGKLWVGGFRALGVGGCLVGLGFDRLALRGLGFQAAALGFAAEGLLVQGSSSTNLRSPRFLQLRSTPVARRPDILGPSKVE